MPANTATYALPYPLGTDPVSDGDDAIKALAEGVETALTNMSRAQVVNRVIGNNTTFTNPGLGVGFPDPEGSALKMTFNKKYASTNLLVQIDATCVIDTGAGQVLTIGIREVGGANVGLAKFRWPAAGRNQLSGCNIMTGLAAGNRVLELVMFSATTASVSFYANDDFVAYSVQEVRP